MEYYISNKQFKQLKTAWKNIEYRDASLHIIYNILRNKPADYGFCKKTKNIQGDDPWYGFNSALRTAKWLCQPKFKLETKKNLFGKIVSQERIETTEHLDWFKNNFGFDMPTDIISKLGETKHE